MKKTLFYLCAALLFVSCTQNGSKTDEGVAKTVGSETAVLKEDAPIMKFEQVIYDFGVIKQGESVKFDFKFKNEGKTPLIITNATAPCGCTVPDYPKTPIRPGESGIIKVVFNSTGKSGMQDKPVTITCNANPEPEKLHLVGEVKE